MGQKCWISSSQSSFKGFWPSLGESSSKKISASLGQSNFKKIRVGVGEGDPEKVRISLGHGSTEQLWLGLGDSHDSCCHLISSLRSWGSCSKGKQGEGDQVLHVDCSVNELLEN